MRNWPEDFDIVIEQTPGPNGATEGLVYKTSLGEMYYGDSRELLKRPFIRKYSGHCQLIFTSPPFPLRTKKRYGNLNGDDYIEWLASFAPIMKEYLCNTGSIVVEIGNVWEPGEPVMSTTVIRALLAFLEKGGLHLCQEFVWYNPARLPSPVQWVNRERIRVKDAFTRIWWMSPTTRPKADNRKILRKYSTSMRRLIDTKNYNAGQRPSHHSIGKMSFFTDNKGAIPPNVIGADEVYPLTSLLKNTNTRSIDKYMEYCRAKGIDLHPARMPREIVEFFVKFLTDEGDLVLDPFAGSNTTGAVCQETSRRWVGLEARWEYASSSISRFGPNEVLDCSRDLEIIEL